MRYKQLGFVALSVFCLVLSGAIPAKGQDNAIQTFSKDMAWNTTYSKGMSLFNENCASCHGENGEGGVGEEAIGLPLNLQSLLTIASKGFIARTIRNGRISRGMPDFGGTLSGAEINAIATYVKGWQYEPSKPIDSGAIVGSPYEGKKWYMGICASCHGRRGEGGPQDVGGGQLLVSFSGFNAPALADSGFKKAATDGFIKATLMYGRMGTPMNSYLKGNQGTVELSEKDINNIVAYLRTMPAIE